MSLINEKLKKNEDDRKRLIEQREAEVTQLVKKANCLLVDNDVLLGALLFVSDPQNKTNTLIADFKKIANQKFPPRKRSGADTNLSKQNSKTVKTNSDRLVEA